MGEVNQVILVGDMAKGIDSGKIDVIVSGDSLNSEYINHLTTRVEDLIERKVVFTLLGERVTSPGLVLFDKETGI